jgi:hypothetical protein
LKIGSSVGPPYTFELDLNTFEFTLPDRTPPVNLNGTTLPIADKTEIRTHYDPCAKVYAFAYQGQGSFHITYTGPQFQAEEARISSGGRFTTSRSSRSPTPS